MNCCIVYSLQKYYSLVIIIRHFHNFDHYFTKMLKTYLISQQKLMNNKLLNATICSFIKEN